MPSVSGKQRRFFGLVLAIKRGEARGASMRAKKVASSISESDARDFASKVEKRKKVAKSMMK